MKILRVTFLVLFAAIVPGGLLVLVPIIYRRLSRAALRHNW